MKILWTLWAIGFLSAPAMAVSYQEFCEIEAGTAKGYVSVTSTDALTISGTVTFRFYDGGGNLIDTESGYEYEYIYNDTELVAEERAPAQASRCTFDVSAAVDNDGGGANGNVDYTAYCEIENGVAKGYVTVNSTAALTIAGTVTLRFFAADGRLIDTESGYEYEYIYNDTELVAEEQAPSGTRWCTFDVAAAVSH
jgi:hypothetical protein